MMRRVVLLAVIIAGLGMATMTLAQPTGAAKVRDSAAQRSTLARLRGDSASSARARCRGHLGAKTHD